MIGKTARSHSWPWSPRALLAAGLAVLFVLAIIVGRAGAPYLFQRSTLQSEVATQLRATTGLAITTQHARFDLLPRPNVTMSAVHVSDPSGTLTLDAQSLNGEVRLLPLIVGRVELADVTLQKPRLTIDLDGRPMPPDSTIGRAVRAATMPGDDDQRLGSITLVDGIVDVASRAKPATRYFSNVNVTVDWSNLDSPASVTGSLRLRNTTADISVDVAQPSQLIRGDHSNLELSVHSAPLDLLARGDVSGAKAYGFKGHVAATAPSLAALFALASPDMSLPAPFANATLDSDATVGFGHRTSSIAVDLQNFHFRADGNAYEGTIAYLGGAKPLVSGTLAGDTISLRPFLSTLPKLIGSDRGWASTSFPAVPHNPIGLDLRVSAGHLRLAPFTIDDAALSVMSREDRLEIGLNEGSVYGGTVKGRMSFGGDHDGVNVRAAGTLTGVDLATLSWDAVGRQLTSGTLSASANLESTGNSAAALSAHLQGWLTARAVKGEVSNIDLGRSLREASRPPPKGPQAAAQPVVTTGLTPYSTALATFRIDNGIAQIDKAAMQGSSANMALAGSADISARTLDLRATLQPPATAQDAPGVHFAVGGTFDKPVVAPLPDGPGKMP